MSQGMGGKPWRESRIKVLFKIPFLKNRRRMPQDGARQFLQGLGVFCEKIGNARAQDKRHGHEAEDEPHAKEKDPSFAYGVTERNTRIRERELCYA